MHKVKDFTDWRVTDHRDFGTVYHSSSFPIFKLLQTVICDPVWGNGPDGFFQCHIHCLETCLRLIMHHLSVVNVIYNLITRRVFFMLIKNQFIFLVTRIPAQA